MKAYPGPSQKDGNLPNAVNGLLLGIIIAALVTLTDDERVIEVLRCACENGVIGTWRRFVVRGATAVDYLRLK